MFWFLKPKKNYEIQTYVFKFLFKKKQHVLAFIMFYTNAVFCETYVFGGKNMKYVFNFRNMTKTG